MYPVVAEFFRRIGADVVRTATKGEGLSILHDEKYIRPDVVAIVRRPSGNKVLIAEGKLLGGHRFLDCVNQAELWLRYADKVYVFFPAKGPKGSRGSKGWKELSEDERAANMSVVQRKRLGLLLVGPGNACECVEDAPQSEEIVPTGYSAVIQEADDRVPEFNTISRISAIDVFKSSSLTYDLADVIIDALKSGHKKGLTTERYSPVDQEYLSFRDGFTYEIAPEKSGRTSISIDPFGTVFEDGVPRILIGTWCFAGKKTKVPMSLPTPPGNFLAVYSSILNERPTIYTYTDDAQVSRFLLQVRAQNSGIGFFETSEFKMEKKDNFQKRLLAAVDRYVRFDRRVARLWKL